MSMEEKYEVLEKIGHGSFGVIRRVKRKADGQILCRKEINYIKMSQKEREQLHAEFSILSSLRHPNIVGYYHREHLKSTQDLHLYMEYCGNGDLGKVIKDLIAKKQYAEESFVWSMFSQLVTALYRCHYGQDPPEVGSNVMSSTNLAKAKIPANGVVILHRDLKPENVFLGQDNSVKLGDFGLSKIMAAHDFASTYVGTPFYMSPEICASERYTLKSDIWSLGCIIYELCAREPPFNAKSHLQLIQRIREGHVKDIPSIYSPELMSVIRDCLKVNSDRRPDTAKLLNLPIVRLMRKEKEVVEMSRILRTKEESLSQRLVEAEARAKTIESEKSSLRAEIEASVRREWEVKARLEIDRQVALELESLQKKFAAELSQGVEEELIRLRAQDHTDNKSQGSTSSDGSDEIHQSSVSTTADSADFTAATDLTEYSMDSPEPTKIMKKSTRTPFARANTINAFNQMATPMDVDMSEPSPISIASLSLSPRRGGSKQAPPTNRNIFARASSDKAREPTLIQSDSEDDDELILPSPSRPMNKTTKNPFKPTSTRPPLISQRTAPVPRLGTQHSLQPGRFHTATHPNTSQPPTSALISKMPTSPSRRLSKIPSSSNLHDVPTKSTPTRKSSLTRTKTQSSLPSATEDLSRLAVKNNAAKNMYLPTKGRTLVELQQARAGGRDINGTVAGNGGPSGNVTDDGTGSPKGRRFVERFGQPAVWDPEKDDMPSPFKKAIRDFRRS